jgi:hypothetical protein
MGFQVLAVAFDHWIAPLRGKFDLTLSFRNHGLGDFVLDISNGKLPI